MHSGKYTERERERELYNCMSEIDLFPHPFRKTLEMGAVSVFSFQIFNATRQLSHIEAAPDKSGLVLLDYWVGLKWCLVVIHNTSRPRACPDLVRE